MRYLPIPVLLCGLIGGPAISQTDPFAEFAGHFHEQTLPAEILCPASGFVLFADGQLLERGIGAGGVETKGGYLCQESTGYASCAEGDIVNNALVVPSAPDSVKRLTLLDKDTVALGKLDGSGQPMMLARCPADFTTMIPSATPAAFLATPPPATAPDTFSTGDAWADVPLAPLSDIGVFAFFPRTAQSAQMIEMMAKLPIDQIPDNLMPEGVDREDLTPEVLTQMTETESCGIAPKVLTRDGLLVEVDIRRPNNGQAFALVTAVSSCGVSNGLMTCARTRKGDLGYIPDNSKGTFAFSHYPEPDGAAYICNPDLGRDHPNSCTQPVACPAEFLSVPVKDFGITLGELPDWSPRP